MGKQPGEASASAEKQRLAHLMGLSAAEYDQLSHTGIRAIRDMDGHVMNYYTIISPLNPAHILQKINMNKMRMVYFPPDALEKGGYPLEKAV